MVLQGDSHESLDVWRKKISCFKCSRFLTVEQHLACDPAILEHVVDHCRTVCDATGVNLTLGKQVGSWGKNRAQFAAAVWHEFAIDLFLLKTVSKHFPCICLEFWKLF